MLYFRTTKTCRTCRMEFCLLDRNLCCSDMKNMTKQLFAVGCLRHFLARCLFREPTVYTGFPFSWSAIEAAWVAPRWRNDTCSLGLLPFRHLHAPPRTTEKDRALWVFDMHVHTQSARDLCWDMQVCTLSKQAASPLHQHQHRHGMRAATRAHTRTHRNRNHLHYTHIVADTCTRTLFSLLFLDS